MLPHKALFTHSFFTNNSYQNDRLGKVIVCTSHLFRLNRLNDILKDLCVQTIKKDQKGKPK